MIIRSSTRLQYRQACAAACVIDNPRCNLSYAERLQALKRRENAWVRVTPIFSKTVKVDHVTSEICGLSAGVYFLGDSNLRDMHYCRLPSSPDDDIKWVKIPGHGLEEKWSGFIVDMGMALHEHDLIVNVISYVPFSISVNENVSTSFYSSEVVDVLSDASRHSLDMVLLKFSTGQYHPPPPNAPGSTFKLHPQCSPSSHWKLWVATLHWSSAVSIRS